MGKLKFLVSLITRENDYQLEQAHAAQMAAHSAGVDVDIIYAENYRITQSTQMRSLQVSFGFAPGAYFALKSAHFDRLVTTSKLLP